MDYFQKGKHLGFLADPFTAKSCNDHIYLIKQTCFPLAHVKTHKLSVCKQKLLQVSSQAVNKLCPHCLFPVVVASLEQAVI